MLGPVRALGRKRARGLAIAALAVAALMPAGEAMAVPSQKACDTRNNNTYQKILECVRLSEVREHQAAFQAIADANGGTRAAGLPGYTGSVDYVVEKLEAAGWDVELDEFDYEFTPPVLLQQLTPVSATYESGAFSGSGFGDVTGSVIPVDINLVPPRASTSGCESTDFTGFGGPNDIALIQRGTCSFGIKALNAQNAGAEAVIIFNQGNDPTREGLIVGTLLPDGAAVTIPVVGGSFANGEALSQAGSTAHIDVDPPESRPQVNVIAEKTGTNDGNVVMAGAHLDSVQAGPGINDNGSGSAALLEVAEQLSRHRPENTLRFAWWGAEEDGLLGSTAYVEGLSPDELGRIALYMNFDMVGSPNYIFMMQDADQSSFTPPPGVPVPDGSVAIEDLFESFYTMQGEPYDDAAFDGRSDYQAFIFNEVPAGGLFTGAEVPKTAEQQSIWGGTVGAQFDPCYHLACDTFANNNDHALATNADSIGFAALTYAYSTESVNGVPGRRVPGAKINLPAPAGSQGTFVP